jgi:hypothetical protein
MPKFGPLSTEVRAFEPTLKTEEITMLRPLAVLGMLALTAEPALAVDQAVKAFVEGAHRIYEASEWGLDLRSRP